MREMKFDVSEIKGGAGGRYRPILQCGEPVMLEEFVSIFSRQIKEPDPFGAFILGTLKNTIVGLLQSGRPVNLGWISFTPRLKGALGMKDASGNPERLEIAATPSRAFRHCLKGMEVVNVNQIPGPLLYELQEDGQKKVNTLHQPSKRIVLNGSGISIDRDHQDEGVWLETANGDIVERATVIYSDEGACHVKFTKLPEKKGIYVFVLSCRNGRGTDFEPKRVTRRVTVR